MRIFHLSDLHIGKQLYGYSLAENQKHILTQIVEQAKEKRPDVIIIAGDIYDKSVPSGEAFSIFDEFLNQLAEIIPTIPTLIIAGNHDSPERLKFASSFLEKHRIYVETMPPCKKEQHIKKVTLKDEYGDIDFWLLPFTKPGYVKELLEIENDTDNTNDKVQRMTYENAISTLIKREDIDYSKRNVLISHQFYKAGNCLPQICDSESNSITLQVGGLDVIDVSNISQFDYVALGHIHGQQKVGSENIRYCGTPLKYSVSEEHHQKSISMVIIKEKGQEVVIEKIPFIPLQDVRSQRGELQDILDHAKEKNVDDFVSITITDEIEPFMPKEQLETVFSHLLELKVDNHRTRNLFQNEEKTEGMKVTPMDNFREFFRQIHNADMTDKEEEMMEKIIMEVCEDN